MSGLARYVPAVGWLRGYRGPWLQGDLVAGVTTAAVVIPQAMAYATIAGLPVQAGLYVAPSPWSCTPSPAPPGRCRSAPPRPWPR